VAGAGFEQPHDFPTIFDDRPESGVKNGALGAREALMERLLAVWPTLSDAAILEVVEHAERLARDANNAR
jgi:hypothetical protein